MTPTLLIIDDHQLLRDMWSKILQDSGKVQVIKYPGRLAEAMEIVRIEKPGVILLDVYMAPTTGFDLLPVIKSYSPQTQVIGFSVHANAAYAKQMLQLGASGYITKHSDLQTVLTAIDEVCNGRQYLTPDVKEIVDSVG